MTAASLTMANGTSPATRRGGRQKDRRVPAGPLLEIIDARGGFAALRHGTESQERALQIARVRGDITEWMADNVAVHLLGLTLGEVYGWSEVVA